MYQKLFKMFYTTATVHHIRGHFDHFYMIMVETNRCTCTCTISKFQKKSGKMRPTWCFRTNHSEHKTSCNFIHRHAKKHVIFGQKISNWSKYHDNVVLCVILNVFKFVGTDEKGMVVCIFTNINLNIDLQVPGTTVLYTRYYMFE